LFLVDIIVHVEDLTEFRKKDVKKRCH
jgi:hypothetical protein